MDKREWELLDRLLCAAYDGKPVTIHKSDRGKILSIEVHEDDRSGDDGG